MRECLKAQEKLYSDITKDSFSIRLREKELLIQTVKKSAHLNENFGFKRLLCKLRQATLLKKN